MVEEKRKEGEEKEERQGRWNKGKEKGTEMTIIKKKVRVGRQG